MARGRCIQKYGASCVVCGVNFGQRYGLFAEGYIQVHHLRPLAEIGHEYVVDPEKDTRPICPNCHAVVHLRKPPFTLDEVASFLRGGRPTQE
jgi:predicted HNH restriction endonuclease